MRKWHKYFIDESIRGLIRKKIDRSYEEISAGTGGYSPCGSYINKEAFFDKYYYGQDYGRLMYYNAFLTKHLGKGDSVLSIASGRCVNELFLLDHGYKITCSDLEGLPAFDKIRDLFPDFEYTGLNILESAAAGKFDAVMCLSLIYLFDADELDRFFKNVSASLRMNGTFILDSAGSPDNLFSRFIHDFVLKYEAGSICFFRNVFRNKRSGLVVKHHGYFRTDQDIVKSADKFGLALRSQENYGGLIDFRRSILFNRLVRDGSRTERLFKTLGRAIPYIRMFKFEKVR